MARARQVAAIYRQNTHIADYCAECTMTMASNHVQVAIKTKNIAAGAVCMCIQEYLDSSDGRSEITVYQIIRAYAMYVASGAQ